MLDPTLLDILACPKCKGVVTPATDHTSLRCEACKLQYRVDDGIPIMLMDEATSFEGEDGE